MKFIFNSTELFQHLQMLGKVIKSKNNIPILDCFLFAFSESKMNITASDMETTISKEIELESNQSGNEGNIAIPAKILLNTLKEFAEQPLTFNIDFESFNVEIFSENGKFSIAGQSAEDYPDISQSGDYKSISVDAKTLKKGIDNTVFATKDDELRPIMQGVFFDITSENITVVGSDSHKLAKYSVNQNTGQTTNVLVHYKAAKILNSLLQNEEGTIPVDISNAVPNNAVFSVSNMTTLTCRLIEGKYPDYNTIIPQDNPYTMTADTVDLYNTIRRVSIFSNQTTHFLKLQITQDQLTVFARDIDYSISGHETLPVKYDGNEDMEIGFKANFLTEILSKITTDKVVLELSESTKAGIIRPYNSDNDNEDILMLIMPYLIGNENESS